MNVLLVNANLVLYQINLLLFRYAWLLAKVEDSGLGPSSFTLGGIQSFIANVLKIYGVILAAFGGVRTANAFKDGQGMSMDSGVGGLIAGLAIVGIGFALNAVSLS